MRRVSGIALQEIESQYRSTAPIQPTEILDSTINEAQSWFQAL